MLRDGVLALLLVGASVGASGAAEADPPLAGIYRCNGVNADGEPYEAIVEIVEYGDTYRVRWTFPPDGESVIGMGVRNQGVLAVMYFSRDPGVIAYRIEDGPRLVGEWTTVGADGQKLAETLTRVEDAPHRGDDSGKPVPDMRQRRQQQERPRRQRPRGVGQPRQILAPAGAGEPFMERPIAAL